MLALAFFGGVCIGALITCVAVLWLNWVTEKYEERAAKNLAAEPQRKHYENVFVLHDSLQAELKRTHIN